MVTVSLARGSSNEISHRFPLKVAVAVTLYSNPFTVLPLYYAAFKLGQLALLQDAAELPGAALSLEGKGFREWLPTALDWLTSVGKPLLVGLPLLAILLAIVGYFLIDWAWRLRVIFEWRRRQLRRARAAQ